MSAFTDSQLDRYMSMTLDRLEHALLNTNRCGNCTKWMKSNVCPSETYSVISGMGGGPSSDQSPCAKFNPDYRIKLMTEALTMKKLESGL